MTDTSLTFQILGATARDVKEVGYTITLFGATAAGKSVSLDVTGFAPFFYLELPDDWGARELTAYKEYLLAAAGMTDDRERDTVAMTTERHRSFWDFTNNRLFTFLKIQTPPRRAWIRLRDVCQDADTAHPIPIPVSAVRPGATGGKLTLRVYEANIDPLLRFFHLRELRPAGWATVTLVS